MLTDKQKKLSTIITFFTSYTFLLLFMHNFLGGTRLNFIPFWLAIFGIIVPVVYQIYRFNLNNSTKLIIFSEIASIILFLNLIRIMLQHNLLTLGGDAYVTLISMDTIKTTSDWLSISAMEKWPGLQLLSLAISEVSGINSYNIALFSPIFYQILAIIFMYLLTKELYNERTALLACNIFAPFYLLAEYDSQFRPEILAYPFLFMCIFAYIKKTKNASSRFQFSFLAILFIICIVITHYTTNAIIILFCAVMLFVYAARYIPKLKPKATTRDFIGSPLTFVLFAIVIWLAYWMYIGESYFELLCYSINQLCLPASPHATQLAYTSIRRLPTLKDEFLNRANQFYIFLFIGLMAYEIFKRRYCKSWQADFWLSCWAGFIFFIWLIFGGRGGILPGLRRLILPDVRLFLFVYPFALMVVTHAIVKLQSPKKKTLFNTLMVGFALLNILTIQIVPLNPLSCSSPFPLENWDTIPDIQAANWIPSSNCTVLTSGPMRSLLPYVKKEGIFVTDSAEFFDRDMNRLKQECDWVYLAPHSPDFKRWIGNKRVDVYLDNETLYKISNTIWLQQVYINGKWEIHAIAP